MSDGPSPEDIESLVEQIEDNTPWDVEDWTHTTGKFDAATVDLEVEWDPLAALSPGGGRELCHTAKDIIEADDGAEGAPVEDVIEAITEQCEVTQDMAVETIDKLKQKGEVYEPRTDHLRVA